MKKIYLIAAVIALAAGVATYFFATELKKTTVETATAVEEATVLIAIDDIPQNTILTKDMFQETKLPKNAVSFGTVCNINEVIGFMATEDIFAGEQLMARKIGIIGNEKADGRLSYQLSNGMYAFTTTIDIRNSMGYFLKEGDKINIYNSILPSATPVLENILILKVGDYAANKQQEAGVEITSYSIITVALTKEQVQKFIEVEGNCRIMLVSHEEGYGLADDIVNASAPSNMNPVPQTNYGMGVVTRPPETEK
ncbi:MAG: Flp pilus assembly protein CpaB [Clostridia bacterium]|nr:Flp pilus assembly protein CpaB [Clostridia bacterium]